MFAALKELQSPIIFPDSKLTLLCRNSLSYLSSKQTKYGNRNYLKIGKGQSFPMGLRHVQEFTDANYFKKEENKNKQE